MRKKYYYISIACLSMAVASSGAYATNGMAPIGIGQAAKGSGGAGVAYPQDSLVAGLNPAGMIHIGDRLDVGVEWFKPDRGFIGNFQPDGSKAYYDANETSSFIIPEFGYNKKFSDDFSFGVSVFGNGGMNTDYKNHPLLQQAAGINLEQVFITPTASGKIGKNSSVGVSLVFAYQRFKAEGLGAFSAQSAYPNNVSDQGNDSSHGFGIRLGWMGQVAKNLSLGATYQPKIKMSDFKRYKGFFAGGALDVPENYALGLAFAATPKFDVLFDVMRIEYGDVAAMGNSTAGDGASPLGFATGPGFGWQDQMVYKLGFVYKPHPKLTLRAGYNYGENMIPDSTFNDFFFNTLATAVVKQHATLGFSYDFNDKSSITAAYRRAFEETLIGNGASMMTGANAGDITMKQDAIGVSYNHRF